GDQPGALELYGRDGRPLVAGTFDDLAAVAILGGAAVAILGVTRPLAALSGRMGTLAQGDIAAEVPGTGRGDELGVMARALLGFRDELAVAERQRGEQRAAEARAGTERREAVLRMADGIELSIGGVTQALGAATVTLTGSTGILARIAEATRSQASVAASGATEASGNVQTVAAAAEQLAASVAEISRQVTESSRMASQAAEVAQRTDKTVRALADGAGRIGEVVRMISGIAGQTNLLALNATIEAARAGEHGKGFAVVASEVKALAAQTAKATDDITGQVNAIQAATGDAVQAILGITTAIGEVNQITAAIAAAVEQQGAATQEIARNVQQAAEGTGRVSESVHQVNQGASESGRALQDVDDAAQGVSRQADTLKTELGGLLQRLRAG
ncbi:MAG: putative methyl-accepting chemotaxis protein, partial [Belnapia sp.]|nr:putative methyl-accepting chemotaxis protein [Belnapia sp.]